MFSSWYSSKEPTRFERNQDLKPLHASIEALKKKVAHLKQQLPDDPVTQYETILKSDLSKQTKQQVWFNMTLAKHDVLARITEEIDQAITTFNNNLSTHSSQDKKESYALVLILNGSLLKTVNEEWNKLAAKRDHKKQTVNDAVDVGVVGSAIGLALLVPLTFGAGAFLYLTAKGFSQLIRYSTGLSDEQAHTVKLIADYQTQLNKTKSTLETALRLSSSQKEAEQIASQTSDMAARFEEIMSILPNHIENIDSPRWG